MKSEEGQLLLFADLVPTGTGSWTVRPRKPKLWVGPAEAARLLGVSHRCLNTLIDGELAQRTIRWRWQTEKRGKRLFESESLADYVNAMGELE